MTAKNVKYSKGKLDKYVNDKMFDIGQGYAVTVVELFHNIKREPELFKIFNLDKNNLEDRRMLSRYDWTVPKLKESLKRLEKKGLMSTPKMRSINDPRFI